MRKLLFDERVTPCGCRLQLWSETRPDGGWDLHIGPCCEKCRAWCIEAANHQATAPLKVNEVE